MRDDGHARLQAAARRKGAPRQRSSVPAQRAPTTRANVHPPSSHDPLALLQDFRINGLSYDLSSIGLNSSESLGWEAGAGQGMCARFAGLADDTKACCAWTARCSKQADCAGGAGGLSQPRGCPASFMRRLGGAWGEHLHPRAHGLGRFPVRRPDAVLWGLAAGVDGKGAPPLALFAPLPCPDRATPPTPAGRWAWSP